MALHKNIIYYSGYCLIILAALSSGVCFGSSPSFKQTVHYHYFLSPEGSEYPIYLHIESPDGPDPLTMKSGLFDQDMADEMPLRPAGEAEALPTQPGQSGYTIWLIERQKRGLNAQDQSFGIPVFARQGGKPCLLMNGDSICGGGQDDIDHKNRKPPMGMGGEFPSGEDLDYEVYSGLAWLNHFASTLMSWQQETVENDDVIIRIIDPDNRQIRLRHINQEDWQSMTRAMHPGISDEDLEKLVRWSQRATVTIQVKNREVLSGAHNAGSGRIPGMISFEDDGGLAARPFVFTKGQGATGGAGSFSLFSSLPGGMRSGDGGDEGGDGQEPRLECPICKALIRVSIYEEHLDDHIATIEQARERARQFILTQSTQLVTPTSKSSGSEIHHPTQGAIDELTDSEMRITLDSRLEEDHLAQVLTDVLQVQTKATTLFRCLGLRLHEVQALQKQYTEPKMLLMKGLEQWISQSNATMKKLIEQLRSPLIRQNRLAQDLEKKYGT